MKKALIALLICLLAVGCACAETAPTSPDFSGQLSFGMTMDEVMAAYPEFSDGTDASSAFDGIIGEDKIQFFSFNGPLTHTWRCCFRDGGLIYTITISRPEDYQELVLPYLTDKYGQAEAAAYEADEYLGWSKVLRERLGEPDFSSEAGNSAEVPDYGFPTLGLTGTSDYQPASPGNPGVVQYSALRYEQWVVDTENGTQVLIHHMEIVASHYMEFIERDGTSRYEPLSDMDTQGQTVQFMPLG